MQRLCYTEAMWIVRQRNALLSSRLSLAPSRLGLLVVALMFWQLLLCEAAPPNGQVDSSTSVPKVNTVVAHNLLSQDTAPADDATPISLPHGLCAIHCSLASPIFPLLLLGALLLAARLRCYLPFVLRRLAAPPLSPPPQPARERVAPC